MESPFDMIFSDLKLKICTYFLDGQFGAMMKVTIENDGPVTIILDSKNPNIK